MENIEIVLYNQVGNLPFKKYLLEYLDNDKVKMVLMPTIIRSTLKEYEGANNQAFFYKLSEFGKRYDEFESSKTILKETPLENVYDIVIKNYQQNPNKQMIKGLSCGPTKKC